MLITIAMAIASYLGLKLTFAAILYDLIMAGATIATIIAIFSGVLSLTAVIIQIIRNRIVAMTRAEAIAF